MTTLTVQADTEFLRLLEPITPTESLTGQEAADIRLARAVWSRITEPGDAIAGAVIAELGVRAALDLVVSADARALAAALRESGSSDPPSSQQLTAAVGRWRPRVDRAATIGDLTVARTLGMKFLTPDDDAWSPSLNDLGLHAPHALWARGYPRLLSTAALAVVGARACTGYGSLMTSELTSEACSAGFTVVSGAAYGVDAVAHRTALALESPTIAVLAGGADRPYPASHAELIGRIAEVGVVCSEMVPGSAPTRWRFLQRNRIIAALSQAVLVTEAGVRSGTLNTAGHGAELGRALGAVPGAVTSAASAGCHRLIRDFGATLITSGAELLELLGAGDDGALFSAHDAAAADDDDPRPPSLHLRLLDALPLTGGRTLDDAARLAGVTTQEAQEALTELELLRYVARKNPVDGSAALWVMLRRT